MTRIRHRTDKYHRQEPADAVRFERYVVDIEHLALEKLPLLQDDGERKPIVACSKHLCGAATGTVEGRLETWIFLLAATSVASPWSMVHLLITFSAFTDVTITCLEHFLRETAAAANLPVKGVVIALCCHDKCACDLYCNQDFLNRDCAFTPRDFRLVQCMSR